MKRLLLAPHDPAELLGGTERVVEAMAAARIRRGDEVAIVAGSERMEGVGAREMRSAPGLSVLRLLRATNETAEVFLRPWIRAEVERVVDGIRPDVIEWHHGSTLSLDLVRATKRAGVPVVMFLHDLWTSCPRFFRIPPAGIRCPEGGDRTPCAPCVGRDLPWEPEKLDGWVGFYTSESRAELAAADLRIVPSLAHGRALQSYFPDLDLALRVVPHGLLETGLSPPARRTTAAESGRLHVVSFGNLVPEKGLEDLVDAIERLPDPSRVSLDLHGRELTPGFVDRLRARAPRVRLAWHGAYASFVAISEDVAKADVAAFPSRAPESYGLVVDEAIAAGLPALVSNRGAFAERAGDSCSVLPAENPDAWAKALAELLDAKALERMRGAVPRQVRTIEEALDEIDALVGRRG
ncbi:MAG TPA: glycosyltransferase [Planctomycetota bacterium]|nr:glycosyltransferase [Planctomycetota bacterium]